MGRAYQQRTNPNCSNFLVNSSRRRESTVEESGLGSTFANKYVSCSRAASMLNLKKEWVQSFFSRSRLKIYPKRSHR
jgi:hypothetical protein